MPLTSLTLPIGSSDNRLTLTQDQVDALIAVYHDANITTKAVSGYVFKSTINRREHYLLTQLGLDVTYDTLEDIEWGLQTSAATLKDGETAVLSLTGDVLQSDVTISIESCNVTMGNITSAQAQALVTLDGFELTFAEDTSFGNYQAELTLKATPLWGSSDAKTATVAVQSITQYHSVYVNPTSLSAYLVNSGNDDKDLINDYISRCKCYLFTADGSKKAEIKSAAFEGVYAGMSSGSVTLADDTQVAISILNGKKVNWMVLRPEMHISSVIDGQGELLINTGVYDVLGGKTFAKKYIGMFKAFTQDGVLKSQPNRIPTGTQTIAVFQSQAKMGGADWGLWNYSDWCKENVLHLTYFDKTNYEENVGVGRINNYNNVRNIVTGFTLPLAGQKVCGRRATVDSAGNVVNCLNFFGIEGLGEQIWEFVIGFRHDATTAYIWDANVWSETQPADRTFTLAQTNVSQQYISTIIAGEHFDMLPRAVGASSATGMCDGHWVSTNGRLLYVGGDANAGSICGLSASIALGAFSASAAALGARLAFYGEPEEISGAEFVALL